VYYIVYYFEGNDPGFNIGETWYITGQNNLSSGCYTVVDIQTVIRPTYVGQWNGTVSGFGGSESPYNDCEQCINDEHSCLQVSQTPQASSTPAQTITPTRTPTVTPTISFTPTQTPTKTPTKTPTNTPTKTPSPTPACACQSRVNTSITVYESIAAPSSAALYQNIEEWYSWLVPCAIPAGYPATPPLIVSDTPPLSLQTESHVSDAFPTKSYSYMISFLYKQNSAASSNVRIAVGTGLQGDCSYGVYNIPTPVNNTWYTLRVDIADISLGGNQIRCHISTPLYSSYNYCTNPGSSSCCSVTTSNVDTTGFPTCPTITSGCIIGGEIGGYWCPY
jgi:hypothetical protein